MVPAIDIKNDIESRLQTTVALPESSGNKGKSACYELAAPNFEMLEEMT